MLIPYERICRGSLISNRVIISGEGDTPTAAFSRLHHELPRGHSCGNSRARVPVQQLCPSSVSRLRLHLPDKALAFWKSRKANIALCWGDSGGALVFSTSPMGVQRYYLRGVASSASTSDGACKTAGYTSFTATMKHEHFIKQFWIESRKVGSCFLPPHS